MPPNPLAVERATAGLGNEASVPSLLSATARALVEVLDPGVVLRIDGGARYVAGYVPVGDASSNGVTGGGV